MSYYVHTPLIAGLIHLFLIFMVLRSNYRTRLNVICSLFLLSMALWAFGIFGLRLSRDVETVLLWDRMTIAVGPWATLLLYHFSTKFTQLEPRKWLLPGVYLVSIILSSLAFTPLLISSVEWKPHGFAPSYGILVVFYFPYVYAFMILSLTTLVKFYRHCPVREKKRQTLLIIMGVSLAVLGAVVDFMRSYGLQVPPLGIVGNLVLGGFVTLAILRYNLLGITPVVRRGLGYTIISGLVTGTLLLALFVANRVFQGQQIPLALNIILILVIAVAIQPLLRLIQRVVDKWFYRERYDQLRALEEFSRQAYVVTSLEQVSSSLVNLIKNALRSSSVSLLMPRGRKKSFAVVASTGDGGRSVVQLEYNGALIRWLRNAGTYISRKDIEFTPKLQATSTADRETLNQLGVELLVPLTSSDELAAILILGPKLSGEAYSGDDMRMLAVVSQQLAANLENVRLYEELSQAYSDLKEAQEHVIQSERLKALGEMTSGIAHDFNNALTGILGNAQLTLRRVDDEKTMRYLRTIEQAAQDAAGMVRRLQDFARVRADRSSEVVDLNEVIKGALDMTRPRLDEQREARGVGIELALELSESSSVEGDAGELREALTNIIINSIEAMPNGGRLVISSKQDDDSAVISISDTGVGMSKEVMKRASDPLFSTKGTQGLGMGLSVVYGIVTRHGGQLKVSSAVGKGSTFTILLPISTKSEAETIKVEAQHSDYLDADVLVVDDDEGCRELLHEILVEVGCRVDIARTGEEALSLTKQKDYDIALIDLGLPDVPGMDIAGRVKTNSHKTRVALVTGWGIQLDLSDLRKKGINNLITKPFTEEEVLTVVGELLDHPIQLE